MSGAIRSCGRVLVVGVAALDRIMELDVYPPEDTESRALAARVEAGGNAGNLARVLCLLGHRAELAAVFAEEPEGRRCAEALEAAGVGLGPSVRRPGRQPVSQVWLSRRNGTRTIVHHRDLPEYPAQALPDSSPYDWVHFEGRNVADTQRMMDRVAGTATVSVEVEKPRPGIERLWHGAGVLFFSRVYVESRGFRDPDAFLEAAAERVPEAILVCAWGAAGAWARTPRGELHHAPAWSPGPVVDTLGAGDTFNAGFIDARLRGLGVEEALRHAVRIAGTRCSVHGWRELAAALAGTGLNEGESP